jgi:hypothetical protein
MAILQQLLVSPQALRCGLCDMGRTRPGGGPVTVRGPNSYQASAMSTRVRDSAAAVAVVAEEVAAASG